MTDLNQLADRVEAGEVTNTDVFNALGGPLANYGTGATYPIALDSLDAAQALHDAVLPGWDWRIRRLDVVIEQQSIATVTRPGWSWEAGFDGRAENPAAAWVAAILRAVAQEKVNG